MKGTLVVLILLALAAGTGCDGDDVGQETTQESPEDGNPVPSENDDVAKSEIVLASGDANIGVHVGLSLCTVYPPGVGKLRGTLTWTSPPKKLVAAFNNGSVHGETTGTSPLTSEHHVSEEGEPWRFVGGNDSATGASVHYVVTFQPD